MGFGEDSVSGCMITSITGTTPADCTAALTATKALAGYGTHPPYVAPWGSYSSSVAVAEWLPLSETVLSSSLTGCPVITAVEYRFLVASQGDITNPQDRIVSARVTYQTADLSSSSSNWFAGQGLEFRTVVSFVRYPNDGVWTEYVPSPPAAMASLPDDILYPIRFSSALSSSGSLVLFLFLLFIAFF